MEGAGMVLLTSGLWLLVFAALVFWQMKLFKRMVLAFERIAKAQENHAAAAERAASFGGRV